GEDVLGEDIVATARIEPGDVDAAGAIGDAALVLLDAGSGADRIAVREPAGGGGGEGSSQSEQGERGDAKRRRGGHEGTLLTRGQGAGPAYGDDGVRTSGFQQVSGVPMGRRTPTGRALRARVEPRAGPRTARSSRDRRGPKTGEPVRRSCRKETGE